MTAEFISISVTVQISDTLKRYSFLFLSGDGTNAGQRSDPIDPFWSVETA